MTKGPGRYSILQLGGATPLTLYWNSTLSLQPLLATATPVSTAATCDSVVVCALVEPAVGHAAVVVVAREVEVAGRLVVEVAGRPVVDAAAGTGVVVVGAARGCRPLPPAARG